MSAAGRDPRERLGEWPVRVPADWVEDVNRPQTAAELEAVRRSVSRGCPLGSADWQRETAAGLGLTAPPRPRGRPRKSAN